MAVVQPGDVALVAAHRTIEVSVESTKDRYDATPGSAYLFRPDHHVIARWRDPQIADVVNGLQRSLAGSVAARENRGAQ